MSEVNGDKRHLAGGQQVQRVYSHFAREQFLAKIPDHSIRDERLSDSTMERLQLKR